MSQPIAKITCDDDTGSVYFDSSVPRHSCAVAWSDGNTRTFHSMWGWDVFNDVYAYVVDDGQTLALYPLPFGYGGARGIERSLEGVVTPDDYTAWCQVHDPIAVSGTVTGDRERIAELADALGLLVVSFDPSSKKWRVE